MWVRALLTEKTILFNRLDITLIDKVSKSISRSPTLIILSSSTRKNFNYVELPEERKKQWRMNSVRVVPIVVSLLHLASSRVDSYGGWNNAPDTQYHIQTDEGEERYFKYQTKSGQYRKEKRLQDGTVVGTYGWVDPNGYLRLRDYVADNEGYRVVRTKMIYVGGNTLTDKTVAAVKNYPNKYSTLVPPSSTPLQNPFEAQSHRFAYIPPSTYHPSRPLAFLTSQTTPFIPPPSSIQSTSFPQTQTTFLPSSQKSYTGNFESFIYQSTPASTYLRRPGEPSPLLQFFPSSTPVVDVSPNSIPKSSTPFHVSPKTLAPTISPFTNHIDSSTLSSVFLEAKSSTVEYSSVTPSPISSTSAETIQSSTPNYASSSASPSVAIFSDSTPKPIAVYSSTPKPAAVNYVSSPFPTEATSTESFSAIGYTASTPSPASALPPVAGKFLPSNNNFITETEKNKLFFRSLGPNDYKKRYVDYQSDVQEYDGISTVQNGFRYFLPRYYHEEQSSSDGQERAGSFGYIDPFGIRRVIYYNSSPGGGFVHRKNNRYVGFNSTPYDPRPY